MNYYGFGSPEEVKGIIVRVCSKFHSADRRIPLIAGIVAVETQFGTYPDTSVREGMGISQIDKIKFFDIKINSQEHRAMIIREFAVDINLASYEDLRYNVFLAILFTVLGLLRIIEALPNTTILEMAKYWKKHWNTTAGAGTIEEFIKAATTWSYLIKGEQTCLQ